VEVSRRGEGGRDVVAEVVTDVLRWQPPGADSVTVDVRALFRGLGD
jgi:hypothetical protein